MPLLTDRMKRSQRRKLVLLLRRNARWVAEARSRPTLWTDYIRQRQDDHQDADRDPRSADDIRQRQDDHQDADRDRRSADD